MSLSLVVQAFVHIAVNLGVFPVTGQTLPMISMGGTSMIFTGIQFGIIMSVSREVMENPKEYAIEKETSESDKKMEDTNSEIDQDLSNNNSR